MKPWQREEWCIPSVSPEFVWRMEDLLDLYAEAFDPQRPVVCLDESPYQLISDVQEPLPARPASPESAQAGHPQRIDYEYQREGNCNLFMFFQPLAAWRHVKVTARRTARDFATCLQELVDVHYPQASTIRLVTDNLNTHTPAVLYETFEPEEARRIARKIEWHYTPKHGSWLNMVEVELSILARQCLDRRLPTMAVVAREVAIWEQHRNHYRATVNWQFSVPQARVKLERLYPS